MKRPSAQPADGYSIRDGCTTVASTVEAYQLINHRLLFLFHLPRSTPLGRAAPSHTHAETKSTQNTTNNATQRRKKTLGKKNDSQTGDAVGQEDLRGRNSEMRRLYGNPRKELKVMARYKKLLSKLR